MMAQNAAVIYIVDDDDDVREALSSLFRSVGLATQTFASAREFLDARLKEVPSCLVLDLRLPGLSGLDLQRAMAERKIQIPIIFITGHADVPATVQAMKAGAVEFLTKPFRDQELLDAVQSAVNHDRTARRDKSELEDLRARFATLTPREREVMGSVVNGMLNKQIAAELGTSEVTVKLQRARAMQKMGASSLADLARMAEKMEQAKKAVNSGGSAPGSA
jgi:FixJ family two-component response regulator